MPVNGAEALNRFLLADDVRTVLDIGSGSGLHADLMRHAGRQVVTIDLGNAADRLGRYETTFFPPQFFDGLWVCHVLEHVEDVGVFLRKCFRDLRPDGLLCVTVPPAKMTVVGGHLSIWNAGLLLYRLILAGFDCSAASVGSYGYNVSVLVRKKPFLMPELRYDKGDIELLASFFPVPVRQGFDGRLLDIRW